MGGCYRAYDSVLFFLLNVIVSTPIDDTATRRYEKILVGKRECDNKTNSLTVHVYSARFGCRAYPASEFHYRKTAGIIYWALTHLGVVVNISATCPGKVVE